MADLDVSRLLKVLGMLGSSHDGEKLAAVARAQAMLKAAGKTWEDVLGKQKTGSAAQSVDARMQAALAQERLRLAQERATFEKDKAFWSGRMQAWQKEIARTHDERLTKAVEEFKRYQATGRAEPPPRATSARGPMHDEYDDFGQPGEDEPDAPLQNTRWFQFAGDQPARAQWIIENKDRKEFAASLYEWVCRTGMLTAKQGAAVDRNICGG